MAGIFLPLVRRLRIVRFLLFSGGSLPSHAKAPHSHPPFVGPSPMAFPPSEKKLPRSDVAPRGTFRIGRGTASRGESNREGVVVSPFPPLFVVGMGSVLVPHPLRYEVHVGRGGREGGNLSPSKGTDRDRKGVDREREREQREVAACRMQAAMRMAMRARAGVRGCRKASGGKGKVQAREGTRTAAVAVEETGATGREGKVPQEQLRNIAIVAHVDHGKTTLVDGMLKQSKVFRTNQSVSERIMDSNDLERERGITILSKNTAIRYDGIKVNIIDTPGHADFGGEVERVLNMCDGVLLLVDSVEGPMPQTRFVLKKALALGLKVVVVVNKIDRDAARPDYVIDKTFELFCELGASDEQCDFPIVYASGFNGIAGHEPDQMEEDLRPLFNTIIGSVSPPLVNPDAPLQLLVTNLDYDEHKGRIAIGRINAGSIAKGQNVSIMCPGKDTKQAKISELFVYDNFSRVPAEKVEAGDIVAVCGVQDVSIGDTIACNVEGTALPAIKVEDPTVRVSFLVNTSPFAGREGKFVTTRNLRDRLYRELERNLAMKVEAGDTADTYIVSGRGSLHITILIENMRREGYEFAVGPPQVIFKESNGKKLEPFEEATVEVPEEYVGSVVDMLGQRKGQMLDMQPSNDSGLSRIIYKMPTRGLLGLRNALLTATRGTAVINTIFDSYGEYCGEIGTREQGSLVSFEAGQSTSYALQSAQARGQLFIEPGVEVYEGQVVGIHQRPGDLKINICKAKKATNIRSNKDQTVTIAASKFMGLDDAIEYIGVDELVEITPKSIRIRKNDKSQSKGSR
eukprot:scaffold287_cov337-Pavlova_lutheri.AAC.227